MALYEDMMREEWYLDSLNILHEYKKFVGIDHDLEKLI